MHPVLSTCCCAMQATQQQGVQWLAEAVSAIPDEAAPAADRQALLVAAAATAAHGQSADSSKCAQTDTS